MVLPLGVAIAEAVRAAREGLTDLQIAFEWLILPEWWHASDIPGFTDEQLATASRAAMAEAVADRET